MAELRCADDSVLGVLPQPVLDRDGVPYEVTLRLTRDGRPFGEVGERCGYFLAATAARLRAARGGDPDGFPDSSTEAGVRAWARDAGLDTAETWSSLQRYLPRDRELFSFRARDPDDLGTVGELRARLETVRHWAPGSGTERAGWRLQHCAVVEAWGEGGVGVRSAMSSELLLAFLERLVEDFAAVGATYDADDDASVLQRPVG